MRTTSGVTNTAYGCVCYIGLDWMGLDKLSRDIFDDVDEKVFIPLASVFLPKISSAIRPFLPPLSVVVTSLCVGAPLAININSVLSAFGISVLLVVIALHLSAFVLGYTFTGIAFHNSPDVKPLQRTLSYETGMQSSLLALALANKFFQDPLVGVPPAISVVIMSLMGFSHVMIWGKKKNV
ncbi:probable sodium/metabolite cotransporter BASS6, chloroplastic [Lactuca sativa]|uniref:probable sodium/metabolite cotransporter BASS6, chloroplastic n=1 Tax=Lactuca sativa TaxID=4236 RepID=UPI000CD9AE39|nr:probable sodium/metabolite cotransporter BASS6, chloroplastic [Lactuca sativa]